MGFELNLSIIFVVLAFILSKNNAKVLLSGYNTMSEADRKQVDLTNYLKYFKRFHLFLGISLLVICTVLRRFNDSAGDIFMVIYPILAYAFFSIKAEKFFQLSGIKRNFNRAMSGFLVCIAVTITYFGVISFRNSGLILLKNELEITGIYGIKIRKADIEEVKLIDSLPPIRSKTNGFNSSTFSKGNFRTKGGKRVKLFVNANSDSSVYFKTVDGEVYYSSDQIDMKSLYHKILTWKSEGQSLK